jgi:hypothetical protein
VISQAESASRVSMHEVILTNNYYRAPAKPGNHDKNGLINAKTEYGLPSDNCHKQVYPKKAIEKIPSSHQN